MAPAGLLALLGLYGWFQTIRASPTLVRWLSPASYDAYMLWSAPLLRDSDVTESFPVSIAPLDSRHAICMLVSAILLAWIAPIVFHTRDRLTFLMAAIAVGSSLTALIGIARQMIPGFQLWSFTSGGEGSPFGTFLNRNNAALLMNLGLGCSLGIIVWRLRSSHVDYRGVSREQRSRSSAARSSQWVQESLPAVFASPISALASACAVANFFGIALCGSRGGILSLGVAGLVALLLIRSGRKIAIAAVVVVALTGTGVLLAMPSEVSTTPLDQFESSLSNQASRVAGDARLTHWPDGLRTFLRHFPGGSGLSSYSFAYLPYQETSTWRWYHHADNLWLEMLVELGLGGIVIWAAFWSVVVVALSRLARSHDPIDEGFRIAGWYCTSVILVSQTFDFGLILPANLFVVSLLLPTIVARSMSVFPTTAVAAASQPTNQKRQSTQDNDPNPSGTPKRKIKLLSDQPANKVASRTWLRILAPVACGVGLLLVGIAALGQLAKDSRAEHMNRLAWSRFEAIKNSLPEISEQANLLDQQIQTHPTPELLNVASRYRFQEGRLIEIQDRRPSSEDEIQDLYRSTSRTNRRLAWRASNDEFPIAESKPNLAMTPLAFESISPAARKAYGESLAMSNRLMRLRPLSLDARTNQIYLEFVHRDPGQTRSANAQAQSLYRNDPNILLSLAAISADNEETLNAMQTWYRVLLLRPEWTSRVLNAAAKYPRVRKADFIPNTPIHNELATKHLKGNDVMRAQFGNDARFESKP